MDVNKKYNIGLTFGAFDPPHFAHEILFKRAKKMCRTLIVCISTGGYIEQHKGRKEFMPLKQRLWLIGKSKYVDGVDVQSIKFGKKQAVTKYRPDVLFVGSDWNPQTYTGEGLGVKVEYLPRTPGISSTELREKSKLVL